MKRILCILLTLLMLLPLYSCSSIETDLTETAAPTTTPATSGDPTAEPTYGHVAQPLTKADLANLPIANSNMSQAELRQLCVDFMRMQLTFFWTPNKTRPYELRSEIRKLSVGTTYSGLPYIASSAGNLYKTLAYYDSETGVLDTEAMAGNLPSIMGNQCSSSAYWAWSRVSNSTRGVSSASSVQANGCYRVGPYTYSDSITNFMQDNVSTESIAEDNGLSVMCESYALMQPADGLVQFVTNGMHGHVIMVSAAPEVVKTNGKIDPKKSSVTVLEQISVYSSTAQPDGTPATRQGGVDVKYTFQQLYSAGYLPYCIPEFCGKDDVEPSQISFSVTENAVTCEEFIAGKITANYPLSNCVLTIQKEGEEKLFRSAFTKLALFESDLSPLFRANTLNYYTGEDYSVTLTCRIGNGEEFLLWEGHFLAE